MTPSVPLSWEKRSVHAAAMSSITIDPEQKPGEFVIKSLFAEFAVLAEKKIEVVMAEPLVSTAEMEMMYLKVNVDGRITILKTCVQCLYKSVNKDSFSAIKRS